MTSSARETTAAATTAEPRRTSPLSTSGARRPAGNRVSARSPRALKLALGGHVLSLPVAAGVLLWANRGQWFSHDEWEFFENRMHGWGAVLFEAHNEHWSTIPILIYRGLFAAFGLRTYLPYAAVLVSLHLVATHLLWRILLRSGVVPSVATGLAFVFAVLGAGAQNLIWAFQIGFVASVLLGLLHLLLVDRDGPFGAKDLVGWAVAVVGLMCSGVSVTMVLVAGLAVLIRRTPKAALATVSVPGAVFVMWLMLIGRGGLGTHRTTLDSLLGVPDYIWTGLSTALERGLGIPGAGAALAVLIAVWMLRRNGRETPSESVPLAMAVGAACLFAIVGIGRSSFGSDQATASRYVYIAFALLVPVLGLILSSLAVRSIGAHAAILAVVGLALVHNSGELHRVSVEESRPEQRSRRQILAAARLDASGARTVSTVPEPVYAPELSLPTLSQFRRDGKLPDDVSLSESDVLAAATYLQVALTREPVPGTDTAPVIVGRADVVLTIEPGRCWSATASGAAPRLELRYAAPGTVTLRSSGGRDLYVALGPAGGMGAVGERRRFELPAAELRYLVISRTEASAVVWLPTGGGTTELCGAVVR